LTAATSVVEKSSLRKQSHKLIAHNATTIAQIGGKKTFPPLTKVIGGNVHTFIKKWIRIGSISAFDAEKIEFWVKPGLKNFRRTMASRY